MAYEPSVPVGHCTALVETQYTFQVPYGGAEGMVPVLTVAAEGVHAKGSVPVSQKENVQPSVVGKEGLYRARAVTSLLRSMAEALNDVCCAARTAARLDESASECT